MPSRLTREDVDRTPASAPAAVGVEPAGGVAVDAQRGNGVRAAARSAR